MTAKEIFERNASNFSGNGDYCFDYLSLSDFIDSLRDIGIDPDDVTKLQKFKKYVHDRLDAIGIPPDPYPAENARTGCRIEGRLDFIENKLR